MQRTIAVMVAMVALALGALVSPPKAHCAFCGPTKCMSKSNCLGDCVCLKSGNDGLGICVSLELAGEE